MAVAAFLGCSGGASCTADRDRTYSPDAGGWNSADTGSWSSADGTAGKCCEPTSSVALDSPGLHVRSDLVVAADRNGPVVFWGNEISNRDQGGVTAVRPGKEPLLFHPGADAHTLSVAAVRDGFLACWSGSGGCLLIDQDLAVKRDWQASFGSVLKLLRVGSGLFAIIEGLGDPLETQLIGLDERGEAIGEPVPFPCSDPWAVSRRGWIAASALGVACVARSDQRCGRQFGEPSDCTYGIELHGTDGALRFAKVGLAPFGSYGGHAEAMLAARDDGLLFAWSDLDGRFHAVPIAPDGTQASEIERASILNGRVYPVPAGYLVAWTAGANDPQAYRWPMATVIGAAGAPLRGEFEVEPRREDLGLQDGGSLAVGVWGNTTLVAWEAMVNTTFYPSTVLFRSLGCLEASH